ncbi:hypothetical protein L3X38_032108 [Prunus dulcis]|uniref:Uncharacterized protein n=1 Tax=Prunus dulcis TaxID=3755 RepID=A0AAD4VEI5_PRUDU|nr:hypothetical protein L3X38_032108 [Prunus dulcis]
MQPSGEIWRLFVKYSSASQLDMVLNDVSSSTISSSNVLVVVSSSTVSSSNLAIEVLASANVYLTKGTRRVHAHQLYPRQAAQIENLKDENTIILEELNAETGLSWPHNRVNPRLDAKELEWDVGHVTRGNTLTTNWTRAGPKERSSRLGLRPIGYPVQVEPYLPNQFGPKINLASTRIISYVDSTFHNLGLKRNLEMETTCNLGMSLL